MPVPRFPDPAELPAPPPAPTSSNGESEDKGVTPEKLAPFLGLIAQGYTISHAAKVAGFSRYAVYRLKADNAAFADALAEAEEAGTQFLEEEARRRAVEGVERPLVSNGQVIATVRDYSDTLLIFLLKARRPNVYRERFSVDQTINGTINVRTLRADDLRARIASLIAKPGLRAWFLAEVAAGAEPALPAPTVQPPLPGRAGHQPSAAGEVLSDGEHGADYGSAE